jgi:alkaline phosphatase D
VKNNNLYLMHVEGINMSITRRQFGGLIGASLGTIALRGYTTEGKSDVYFSHGVASGDPLQDRVILWTRVIPGDGNPRGIKVQWQISIDNQFTKVINHGRTIANPSSDFTVKIDADGLKPSQKYFYRFISEGVTSHVGTTKTLPIGEVSKFRIGLASCSNFPQGYFNAYQDMAAQDLDLVLHLGDYIYEYPDGEYANQEALDLLNRHVKPAHEILTLEDYRTRYGVYRSDQNLQEVHKQHPFICVWDDHEMTNDTWKTGAENHNEGEGDFLTRIRAARQAYHEWMPIRTHYSGKQGPIFRSFKIGDIADLIMLDTRIHGRDRGLSYQDDISLLMQWFDTSDELNIKKVTWEEARLLPQSSRELLKLPFDHDSDKPLSDLDYDALKKLSTEIMKDQWVHQSDLKTFESEILGEDRRTMLGEDQEKWVREQAKASIDRGATWQILGQQVLMGKVITPHISSEDLRKGDIDEQTVKFWQILANNSMPLNLDAWDGYPSCRNRVQQMFSDARANPIVLAGDTHNAWGFNLKDDMGDKFGVEIGAPGITSPGWETYIPINPKIIEGALYDSSEELAYIEASRRGWAEVTLSRESVSSRWHFVDEILSKNFTVTRTDPMICLPGSRHFVR